MLGALGFLGRSADAQQSPVFRLNERFVFDAVVGDVRDFQVRPDGQSVLFRADARRVGVWELFSAPAVGGALRARVNALLPADRSVIQYEHGAAGSWTVFIADQDADDVFELFSRAPGDEHPRRLNAPLVAGGDVLSFALTPDASMVVYRASQDAAGSPNSTAFPSTAARPR